ncbi:sigma-70 family RNA polymerase sigma factor [Pseudomonas sp. ABC1]|nr:sigma-70 family RNA polymerase sigma factor [Pseudomonas sp. ABC1]
MHPPGSTDKADVQTLYHDHHAWLLSWLRRRLHSHDSAPDLAHDTFLYALIRPEQTAHIREPRAWLRTIAHGLMIDQVRRRKLEQAYLASLAQCPEAEAPSPETRLLILETLAQIDALLDGMPSKVRSAFLLSRLEGMGYREIAQHLDVSISSVEKYMASAIRHCYLVQRRAGQ